MGVVRYFTSYAAAFQACLIRERKAKNILCCFKQQFEAFKISNSEGLEKGYDRFQQLLSQLEAHGAEVSTEDAYHKFLRSLLQHVSQKQCSTNKVKSGFSGAYSTCTPSTSSTNAPEKEVLAGFADEVIYSLFAKQTEDLDLLHEDLEQIDDVDIEEMDINWQIAMIAIRMKKFYKKYRKESSRGWKNRLLALTKRSLSASIVTTLVTLLGNVQQRGHMMGRRREILFINIKKLGSKKRIRWVWYNGMMGLSIGEEHTEAEKQIMRIGMGAVKEKEQLQKTVDSWKDSSKNLWRLINSGMSSNDKLGLGFEIQSNDEVLSYEEGNEFFVFKCSKRIQLRKNLRTVDLQRDHDFKRNGSSKLKNCVSDDNSSEHSTCQSNDSEGSCGNTSEHSFETESESVSEPSEMSKSSMEVTNEKDVSAPKSRRLNLVVKKCFVCGSLSHLIKDCDYYEKKMAREAEVKRVVNTGNRVAKPVWTNANRINHANQFVPRSVQLNAGRPKFNSVRPNINTGRTNINSGRPKVNTVSPKVNTVRSKQPDHPMKAGRNRRYLIVMPRAHDSNKDQLEDFEEFQWGICYLGWQQRIHIRRLDQANPHAGASEVNTCWLLQLYASEEKDEDVELIVVPSAKLKSVLTIHLGIHSIHPKKVKYGDHKVSVKNRSKCKEQYGRLHSFSLRNLRDVELFKMTVGFKPCKEELLQFKYISTIDEEVYVSQPHGFVDPESSIRFQMSSMGELTFFLGLQVKQNKGGIFISQDKYVAEILKKFDLVNVKAAITPMETKLPLTKDEEAFAVDCSLRIFSYLRATKLGLMVSWEIPMMEAFSDSDYGGSNLDRKSTTGGCQFLGQRLISWQCKKQTIVATSTTEAEYVAAANCCGQVLWVQNQLLDYGFNFMNTKIHIDNESTICIVKNPVYHSKTKHIEIRHHFIRDCYEKKLISVEKIHTDLNVADLLTKPFDGPRFNYLVVSIGMINK
ncbi:putative ribonuclease H-like domain-containing protein [Tanacetum coccineum]